MLNHVTGKGRADYGAILTFNTCLLFLLQHFTHTLPPPPKKTPPLSCSILSYRQLWRDKIEEDIGILGIYEWQEEIKNRKEWRCVFVCSSEPHWLENLLLIEEEED